MPEVSSPPTGSSMTGSSRSGARDSSPRSPTSTTDVPPAECCDGRHAQHDLSRRRGALGRHDLGGAGTRDDQLVVGLPHQEQVQRPVWIPTDIRRFTFAPGSSIRPTVRNLERISSAAAQARSRWSSSSNTAHPSPPNFRSWPPCSSSDAEERVEARVDRLGDVLGALASTAGQALGQLGETGDVDEDGGSLDDPVVRGGGTHQPSEDGARQERLHGARFGRAHRHSGRGYLADGDVRNQARKVAGRWVTTRSMSASRAADTSASVRVRSMAWRRTR